jgi:elongation factor P hydroxylase
VNREAFLPCAVSRQLHKLCQDHPPVNAKERPSAVRWILFDAGHYPAYAKAYLDGLDGKPAPDNLSLSRAAWLAGHDARDGQ